MLTNSYSDWPDSPRARFGWLRGRSNKHHFENRPQLTVTETSFGDHLNVAKSVSHQGSRRYIKRCKKGKFFINFFQGQCLLEIRSIEICVLKLLKRGKSLQPCQAAPKAVRALYVSNTQ